MNETNNNKDLIMKKRYIILLGLTAIAAGFYFLTPSFESIVKQAVHKYGSAVTGTDVNLDGFKLKIADGEGHIGKITVGNPQNYKLKNALELGGISVKVDIKSLTKDVIIIENVEINKPVINYELLSLTQNNLSQLLENIKKNTASAEKVENTANQKAKAEPQSSESQSAGKKVIIRKLTVKDGEVSVAASAAADLTKTTVKLPAITLNNIGEEKKGATVAETASKILSKIINTAYQTVVESKITDFKNVAKENLDNVVGGVKDRIKEIGIFGK